MGSAGPSVVGCKRESPKEFEIEFKVFEHLMNPSKRSTCLKLAKPHEPNCEQRCDQDAERYPSVTVKTESCSSNDHAFGIMHGLNHRSLLSLKTLYKSVSDVNNVSAVVEEFLGSMDPHYVDILADKYGYIPSDTLQRNLRDLIDGVNFLKECDTYHGNLKWITSLFNRANDIKLANFKEKDDSINKRQAQWNDWLDILAMLLLVYNYAIGRNQDPNKSLKFFCGNLEELINILSSSDINSLDVIKDKVLEAMFFWSPGTRARFLMVTVSLLLSDKKFMKDVEDKEEICDLPWNKNFTSDVVAKGFEKLMARMNAHRDGLGMPHYKTGKRADFLRLICGAYTHKNEIKLDVDYIVRAQFPELCNVLKRFVENRRN